MSSDATHLRLRCHPSITPPQRPPRDGRHVRCAPLACQPKPGVIGDLPTPIPITAIELDVIETYLGDQLARLLGRIGEEAAQPEKEKPHGNQEG